VLTTRAGSTAARLDEGSEVGVLARRSGCSSWRFGRAGLVVELASRTLHGATLATRPVQAILIVAFRDDVGAIFGVRGGARRQTDSTGTAATAAGTVGAKANGGETRPRPEQANDKRAQAIERWYS
jgi:hypothetical protein